MKKSKYFTEDEMKCKHCGKLPETSLFDQMLTMLDEAREVAGIPFFITSGYRCPEHDQAIGGEGNHPIAAVDILADSGSDAWEIMRGLFWAEFKRIGVSRKKKMIHADIVPMRPTPALWTYGE